MHLHNSLVVFLKYAKSRIFQWYACYWQISFMWECSLFFLLCLFLWQVKKWSHLQVISKHCVIGYNRRNKYTAGELVSEFLFSLGSMVKIFRYKINQTHVKAILVYWKCCLLLSLKNWTYTFVIFTSTSGSFYYPTNSYIIRVTFVIFLQQILCGKSLLVLI